MKILSNRILSILLTAVLIFGILSAAELTADAATVYSVAGTCGKVNEDAVHWYAFNDRTMVFLGKGPMKDYALDKQGYSTAPWFSADLSVVYNTIFSTKIVVESGVTTVGDYAFYLNSMYSDYVRSFMTISTIDLSDTVTYIGKYAFYNQLIENINIPPSVTHIGTNAFSGCSELSFINYFGDPGTLTWDRGSEAQFKGGSMTCHILEDYRNNVASYNARFSDIGLTFTADLQNPYENAGEELGIDRNIALYYGATSTDVFAGAVPFIVVGTFDGNKKSTTYGSRGFVSCVQIGSDYYLMTDTNGTLKKVTIADELSGRADSTGDVNSKLNLKLRHEYIGNNIVKVVYTLTNKTNSPVSGLNLGGSGDIKIGADDRASIQPLKNSENTQVGFYMTSSNAYDKDSHNEYATLGFIGDNIVKQGTETYPNASFFYGAVGTNLSEAAAGVKDAKVYPQRIFEGNGAASHSTDGIASGTDTGMSYHWENISLGANESKEYAILFSVYGNNSDGKAMVNDLTATYHTVTWVNYDGTTVLQKQVVKEGASPAYSGLTPEKPMDYQHYYEFSGWSSDNGTTVYSPSATLPVLPENGDDITYTAQYANIGRPFFSKHSLTLEGDIGVNFYVDVATIGEDWSVTVNGDNGIISNNHTVKLDFKWYNKHTTYTLEPGDYDKSQRLFKATCNVAAAEMMYPITVKVYVDNSTTALTDHRFTERYRVRDYADVILDPDSPLTATYRQQQPDDYANLVTLTKTMLDYGAKAQVVFDRYRDKDGTPVELANNGVSYTMSPYNIDVELPDMETTSNGQLSDYGLTYYGASIVFLSKTTLRQYYKITNRTAFEQMVNDTGFQYKVNGSYIYIDQENIAAADLDKEWDFVIGNQTYKCSAMQIGRKMQEADRYGEHDLATAMYHYNVAADAFFQ